MSGFEHGLGLVQGKPDERDYIYGASEVFGAALPEEYLPEIKATVHDQGEINNCATHALTASLENVLGGKYAFSWVYGNRRHTDHKGQGTVERDLLKTVQKDGCLVWAKYPYEEEMPASMERFEREADPLLPESRKLLIKNYWNIPTFDAVCHAIYSGKMVQLGFQVFDTIKRITAKNPVLQMPVIYPDGSMSEWRGGHMVWATGFCRRNNQRCIRCRNSWGESWGENGDFYIPEEAFTWSQRIGFPLPLVDCWAFELAQNEQPDKPCRDGWVKAGDRWKYFENGAAAAGWKRVNGVWYYMDPDGYMAASDWRMLDGHWYYLTSSGAMARSWRKIGGYWYYFNLFSNADGPNGAMLTGLREIDGKRYYLNEHQDAGYPFGALVVTDGDGVVQNL